LHLRPKEAHLLPDVLAQSTEPASGRDRPETGRRNATAVMPTIALTRPAHAPTGQRATCWQKDHMERLIAVAAVASFFTVGYFYAGLSTDPNSAARFETTLDRRIPFVSASVWVYVLVYPTSLLPLFVVRCPRLFRRTVAAYAATIAVSLAFFIACPVTSIELRPPLAALVVSNPSDWLVTKLYGLDPPSNLFPSLHISIAMLAALSAWKANRLYGSMTFMAVGPIALSVCMVKQHFVVDGIAAVFLVLVVAIFVLHPYRAAPGFARSYSWRGLAAYLGLLTLFYMGLYGAYLCS
jgi:hypothetical protein